HADGLHLLVLLAARPLPRQTLRRLAPGHRPHPAARLVQPEAACARPHLRSGEVMRTVTNAAAPVYPSPLRGGEGVGVPASQRVRRSPVFLNPHPHSLPSRGREAQASPAALYFISSED